MVLRLYPLLKQLRKRLPKRLLKAVVAVARLRK